MRIAECGMKKGGRVVASSDGLVVLETDKLPEKLRRVVVWSAGLVLTTRRSDETTRRLYKGE